MSKPFVPIKTAEISWINNLPFSLEYKDVYFSEDSGLGQSNHVFINGNDLINRWENLKQDHFVVAEIGFGTGLNFINTWKNWEQHAPKNAFLHYYSCEKNPLKLDDLKLCLSLWPELSEYAQLLIDNYPILTPGFHLINLAQGRIKLFLMLGDALECFEQLLICGEYRLESKLRQCFVDAWYLDGFAPSKNEAAWSVSLCAVLSMLSKTGSTLSTYSAAGMVKEHLKSSGFDIRVQKGFGKKRHMLIATYAEGCALKYKHKTTPWHYSKAQYSDRKTAIVVGGGLAGSCTAYHLANRGYQVHVLEGEKDIASKASANTQAVLFPKLSAYKSPLTQLMLSSFLYSSNFYKKILAENQDLGELKGCLLLAHNSKERKSQEDLYEWLDHYPELGILVDSLQASLLAGIEVDNPGLFIPLSGWINSQALCTILLNYPNIHVHTDTTISSISYDNNLWQVGTVHAPILILCTGHQSNQFEQTDFLPIKAIHGQMTEIAVSQESRSLKIPLCGVGHVVPNYEGRHHIGASYNLGQSHSECTTEDDELNIKKLSALSASTLWCNKPLNHWAGVRATTPDYLPIVGPVPIQQEFNSLYETMNTNAKRWIPKESQHYPGLYVCSGFGSRGLTTIPLCTEWLVSKINHELGPLPRNLIQSLSPARFLRKAIIESRNYKLLSVAATGNDRRL